MNGYEKDAPHSRACGFRAHAHGVECSRNCPTCQGKPWSAPQADLRPEPGSLVVLYDMAAVQKMCGAYADEKGFWDRGHAHNTASTQLINMIAELTEAWEEIRDGHQIDDLYYRAPNGLSTPYSIDPDTGHINKPEGVPAELADTVIRIMDTCEHAGLNLAELIAEKLRYNATRGHRHGGKVY